MKKIGVFIRSLKKGGAENQSILLSQALSKEYDTCLIVFFGVGEFIKKAQKQLPSRNIIFVKGSNYFTKTIHLYFLLRRLKLDVLFCYLPSNNIVGSLLGKITGIPKVFGGLRGSSTNKNKLKMFTQKLILNNMSTAIISNSYKAKETYSLYGIDKKKIHVIHNAISCSNSYQKRKKRSVVEILTIGRFVKEKDYLTSLQSIKTLISKNQNIHYTIVGYGEREKEIKEYIQKLVIGSYVTIHINPEDVNPLYKNADLFLLTSLNEGMPNTVMEAMSFSLPIVATDVGDVKYLVINDENGYLCRKRDVGQIVKKMNLLINSHALRLKFGKKSFELVNSNFNLEKLKCNYKKLIDG